MSGTKKEVRDWKISGTGANFFKITDYGLLQMEWEPAYGEPVVTATVTAVLEDGRKLTANVRAYSELNIYMDRLFTDFEERYIYSLHDGKGKGGKSGMVCQYNF